MILSNKDAIRIKTAAIDYFQISSVADVRIIAVADAFLLCRKQVCYCVAIQEDKVSVGRFGISISVRLFRPALIDFYGWQWLDCPIHESNILGCCKEVDAGLKTKSKLVSSTMIHTYDEPAVWLIHGNSVIGNDKLCKYHEAVASCEAIAYLIDVSMQAKTHD